MRFLFLPLILFSCSLSAQVNPMELINIKEATVVKNYLQSNGWNFLEEKTLKKNSSLVFVKKQTAQSIVYLTIRPYQEINIQTCEKGVKYASPSKIGKTFDRSYYYTNSESDVLKRYSVINSNKNVFYERIVALDVPEGTQVKEFAYAKDGSLFKDEHTLQKQQEIVKMMKEKLQAHEALEKSEKALLEEQVKRQAIEKKEEQDEIDLEKKLLNRAKEQAKKEEIRKKAMLKAQENARKAADETPQPIVTPEIIEIQPAP